MKPRQQEILLLSEKYGEITIKELAKRLKVTEMTIHRDLDYLEGERLIHKKRGAAVFIENTKSAKKSFYYDEKRAIGKKAASMLKEGMSVVFDNSTTAIECARFLDDSLKLTCYTTNLEIANILTSKGSHIVYCSGGYYFPDTQGFIGQHAEEFISKIKADIAIVGASGISIEEGITNPYPLHNTLQSKIIHSAKQCILLADHSKFDRTAMENTCSLSEINHIITDSGISEDTLEKFRPHIDIIIAEGE